MANQPFEGAPRGAGNHFDALRLALAAAVVLSHSFELLGRRDPLGWAVGPGTRLGDAAVAGFFLISGSLIVASWRRGGGLRDFARKRALRIVPGFAVAYLFSVIVVGRWGGGPDYFASLSGGRTLLGLVTLGKPATPPVFLGQHHPEVNASLWTIRQEAIAYAVVAALGVAGLVGRRRAVLGLAAAALAGHWVDAATGVLGGLPGHPGVALRLFSFFLVGACAHLYADSIRFTRVGGVAAALALLAAGGLGPAAFEAALPLAGGYLLFAAAFAPWRAPAAWGRAPDVSYGLYLYAWPIQVVLIDAFPGIGPPALFAATMALGVAAGAASWSWVEGPCQQFGRRPSSRPPRPRVAAAPAGIALGVRPG